MRPFPLVCLLLLGTASLHAAESFEEALARTRQEYTARIQQAADELNQVRARIAGERAPLLERMRAAEGRIIAAQSETTRWETAQENAAGDRRTLLQDLDGLRRNTAYVATLAHDAVKALEDGLPPGETSTFSERLAAVRRRLEEGTGRPAGAATVEATNLMLEAVRGSLGGRAAAGQALLEDSGELRPGAFAFVGPETFFIPAEQGPPATVRTRPGTDFPVAYSLPGWRREEALALVEGRPGEVAADASAGKALRLQETNATLLAHINKGGFVAYAIVVVGLVAFVLIVQKIRDLLRAGVDEPAEVRAFLDRLANSSEQAAAETAHRLGPMTRELMVTGLRHIDDSKAILEEQLEAVLLRQRLHLERRLPLLAVIATAAPLMGLLGTVVGMVRTFALITVFGTGNAGKLSSGISEVLVATELGLTVAIPTLVAHGFLAHRVHKQLALLERYALQFVTTVEVSRRGDATPSLPA